MRTVTLSPHAEERVKERLTLTPDEVLRRLGGRANDTVARLLNKQPVTEYVVIWDEGLNQGVLAVLRRLDTNSVEVITVYTTHHLHYRYDGVVVEARHITVARNRYLRLQRRRIKTQLREVEKLQLRLKAESPKFMNENEVEKLEVILGTWPLSQYEAGIPSLVELLKQAVGAGQMPSQRFSVKSRVWVELSKATPESTAVIETMVLQ